MKELKEIYDVFLTTSKNETDIQQLIGTIECNGYKKQTAYPLIWYYDKFLRSITIDLRNNIVSYQSLIEQLKEGYELNKKQYPNYTTEQHEMLLCKSIIAHPEYKELTELGII